MTLVVRALGACHPDCRFCAREFWKWYAGRMLQMEHIARWAKDEGQRTSFAEAAATSIGAIRPDDEDGWRDRILRWGIGEVRVPIGGFYDGGV